MSDSKLCAGDAVSFAHAGERLVAREMLAIEVGTLSAWLICAGYLASVAQLVLESRFRAKLIRTGHLASVARLMLGSKLRATQLCDKQVACH